MPALNYKIEDDHFIVTSDNNNSTKYFYIGSMDGVTAEVVTQSTYPKGHIDLKINFPHVGTTTFPINYRTFAQSSVAKYRAEEVIKDLQTQIKNRKNKKVRVTKFVTHGYSDQDS